MIESLLLSILVVTLSGLGVTVLALPLAMVWTRFPYWGYRFHFLLVGSFLLVPTYVQAASWSAGFGTLGWWTLSQVDASQSLLVGVRAVIWIHSMSCFPAVTLLLMAGMRCVPAEREALALMEGGIFNAFRFGIAPTLAPWILVGVMWTACMTTNDMLVTNLFRVSTMTEQVYLDVTMGQWSNLHGGLSLIPTLLIALIFGWLIHRIFLSDSHDQTPQAMRVIYTRTRWHTCFAGILGWVVVAWTVAMPITNLVLKAGWDPRQADGHIVRKFSVAQLIDSVSQAPMTFSTEFYWTLQIAFFSATLSLMATLGMFPWLIGKKIRIAVIGGIAAGLMALPGPWVNIFLLRIMQSAPWDWMHDLRERTLLAPVLGLQSRCFPIALWILIFNGQRWFQKHVDRLRMEGRANGLPLIWFFVKNQWTSVVLAWVVCSVVAASDLASYLLVLPTNVTTLAMRIFELLHYGVRYEEAGLCLLLCLIGMAVGGVSLSRYRTKGF